MFLRAMDEQALKRELVYSCRILDAEGQGDDIFGHVSARLAGWDRFWMKPAGIGLDEVTVDDLILVDMEGTVLAGSRPRHEEYPIHSEIMRARPDVLSVVHTHPPFSTAFAARGTPLRPVSHAGTKFWPPGIATFDEFTDLVRTRAQGERVAHKLQKDAALFLLNHGIAVSGSSVADACYTSILLERAAKIQLLAEPSKGADFTFTSEEESELKQAQWFDKRTRAVFDYYVRKYCRHLSV